MIAGVYLLPLNIPARSRMQKQFWSTVSVVPKTLQKEEPSNQDLEENYTENMMKILHKIVEDFNSVEKGFFFLLLSFHVFSKENLL